jgi:hypothetical protein
MARGEIGYRGIRVLGTRISGTGTGIRCRVTAIESAVVYGLRFRPNRTPFNVSINATENRETIIASS